MRCYVRLCDAMLCDAMIWYDLELYCIALFCMPTCSQHRMPECLNVCMPVCLCVCVPVHLHVCVLKCIPASGFFLFHRRFTDLDQNLVFRWLIKVAFCEVPFASNASTAYATCPRRLPLLHAPEGMPARMRKL